MNLLKVTIRLVFISLIFLSFQTNADDCPNWDKNQAILEFENLNHKLKIANREYRLNGKSDLTDQEYDYLRNQLSFWQKCFNFLPQNLERDYLFAGKVIHSVIHSKIYKAKSEQEINAFLHKNLDKGVWLMPKVDGIAISLIYKEGKLVQAITRGDGIYGEDVTEKVQTIKNIPKVLQDKIDLILQGEFYWIQNQRIEKNAVLSNAREKIIAFLMQKTSMALKDKNKSETLADVLMRPYKSEDKPITELEESKILDAKDNIGLFVWEVPQLQTSMQERLDFLEQQGFGDTKKYTYKVESIQEVKNLKNYFYTKPMKFATDGIVLNASERPDYKKWTNSNKYWSIAWKHNFVTSLTKVKKITYSVGRTGRVTPIVYFEPIKMQGRNYTKASLGSLNILLKMQLKSGDLVEVKLAGGIIPKVEKVVWQQVNSKKIEIPDFSNYSKTSCMQYSTICREQFLARLVYISEELPIRGVKQGTWDLLINAGLIKKLSDWKNITANNLLEVSGINTKSAKNISTAFKVAKQQSFVKYLHSLGLPLSLDILEKAQINFDLAPNLNAWTKISLQQWQKIGVSKTSADIAITYLQALNYACKD